MLGRLLALQVRGLVAGLGGARRGQGRRAGMAVIGVAAVVLLACVFFYVYFLGKGLVQAGLASAIPLFAVLLGSLGGVVFTFLKANGVLFGFRDYDLVMSLPIPTSVVVLSRVGALFAASVASSVVVSAPLYVAYFEAVAPSAGSVALAVAGTVAAPLAPTSAAVFAAFAVSALAARFRHANVVSLVLSVVLLVGVVAGVFAASFSAPSSGTSKAEALMAVGSAAGALRGLVAGAYPPAAWFADGLAAGSWGGLAAFAAISLVAPAAAVAVVTRWYAQLNAALVAHGTGRGFSASQMRDASAGPLRALVGKELARVATLPVYALNCGAGLLLMVMLSVALAFVGIEDILGSGVIDGVGLPAELVASLLEGVLAALPWVFGFCAVTGLTAAPAVSLEGRAAWVMSTLPLPPRTVYGSKLLANLALGGAATGASLVVLLATASVPVATALECAAVSMGTLAFFACLALSVDLRSPNFAFASPHEVVKRGAPIMVAILAGTACVLGGGYLAFQLATDVGPMAGHAFNALAAVALAAAGGAIFLRATRSPHLYVA